MDTILINILCIVIQVLLRLNTDDDRIKTITMISLGYSISAIIFKIIELLK